MRFETNANEKLGLTFKLTEEKVSRVVSKIAEITFIAKLNETHPEHVVHIDDRLQEVNEGKNEDEFLSILPDSKVTKFSFRFTRRKPSDTECVDESVKQVTRPFLTSEISCWKRQRRRSFSRSTPTGGRELLPKENPVGKTARNARVSCR